jgi:glycosyltransferase involved in cell wall biosynthesis
MILTSKFEGTPMCALEALALGVPIVSTPVDGMSVLIKEGENGFLSEDNEVLAQGLVRIIESESLRKKLSRNAVEYSKKINDVQKYRDEILRVYRN